MAMSTTMATSYDNYEPLGSDDETRILTLLPGSFEDEAIRVTLDKIRLDGSVPEFDAVSYVWSDDCEHVEDIFQDVAPPRGIVIESQTVAVKANLHALLLHFRHNTEPRLLWVDAICINQADTREREQQVKLMSRIYSEARSTLMWVGLLANFGDCANTLIKHLMDWETPNLSTKKYREYRETVNPRADDGWMGLMALLHRAYWKRIWIVQEVLISRNPVLCFGYHHIPFRLFSSVIQYLEKDGVFFKDIRFEFQLILFSLVGNPSRQKGYIMNWPPKHMTRDPRQYATLLIREAGGPQVLLDWMYRPSVGTVLTAAKLCRLDSDHEAGRRLSLLQALIEARSRESTEDLDRVYAMLGLTSQARINVDYQITTNNLYTQVTKAIIETTHSLDILSACVKFRRYRTAQLTDKDDGLPSWIPDWRSYHPANGGYVLFDRIPCVRFSASGPSTPQVTTYKDGSRDVLRAAGRRLGSLCFTYPTSTDWQLPPAEDTIWKHIQDTWTFWSFFVRGKPAIAERLKRTKTARWFFRRSFFLERRNPPSPVYGDDVEQRVAWGTTQNLGVCKDHLTDDPEPYYHCPGPGKNVCPNAELVTEAYNRLRFSCPKFFISDTGHMGRGPYSLKEGDILVILCGAKVPFALRQEGSKFLLLGECYVAGVMDGEAVQGSTSSDSAHLEDFDII